jgi:cell fate regulator YaaT (PSP1 superfamily)
MACTSCGSGGCSTKTADGNSSGGCGGGCSTGGCNKLNVFDWLSDMDDVGQPYPIVEVRFKGGRKEFFKNTLQLDLTTGDPIVVEVPNGHHLGFVSLQGELVRLQLSRKNVKEDSEEVRLIYRVATEKDIEKYEEMKVRELPTLFRARQIINELKLNMKLSDVEFQSDNTKATFYYSAEERVDFRELIKLLAGEFKVRVEMRQISLRQEASRLGGIGSCGRELCCSTWINDFKSVSTSAARYQNLSLNPSKLSGQCGRLKCCLNYELDTYMDALRDIPMIDRPLLTEKGDAHLQKTDIFRRIMWFGYAQETTWHPLPVERVKAILELNKKGQKAVALTEEEESIISGEPSALNDDLDQMDRRFAEKDRNRKRKRKKTSGNGKPETAAATSSEKPAASTSGNTPRPENTNRPPRRENVAPPTNNKEPRTGGNNRPPQQARDRNRGGGGQQAPQGSRRPPQQPRPEGDVPQMAKPIPVPPKENAPQGTSENTAEGSAQNRNNRNSRNRNRNRGRGGNNPNKPPQGEAEI